MTWDENILWTFKIHLHVFGPLASSLIMLQKNKKKQIDIYEKKSRFDMHRFLLMLATFWASASLIYSPVVPAVCSYSSES